MNPYKASHFLLIAAFFSIASWANQSQAIAAQQAKPITVRVAAISYVPQKFDLQANANQLEKAFRKAHAGGAKIAVAPEGALDGYVINEIVAGKEPAKRMKEVAIAIDDPLIKRFQKLAKQLKMCLVFAFAEKIKNDVYNSAIFIDHTGTICGKYHKMQFAEGYDKSWWFNRLGSKSRAFDTPYGRCGVLICNDRWNAKLARIPALDGAQFLVIPTHGSTSKKQDQAVLNRGKENKLPVIEANVGVTLIVNKNQIVAVERRRETVTFADITIPRPTPAQPKLRNKVEQEFLKWRKKEMPKRLKKRQASLNNKR